MAFRKSPSYLWRHPKGAWYFKRPIPPDLQSQFPRTKGGKPTQHVLEALGTHSQAEAEKLKRPHAEHWEREFRRMRGQPGVKPSSRFHERMHELRKGFIQATEEGRSEDELLPMFDIAQDLAKQHAEEVGHDEALHVYEMTVSGQRTLLEHMEDWLPRSGLKNQTQDEHRRAVRELLAFLKRPDCLPSAIKEDTHAVAYVEHLNDGPLSIATKKGRLSSLGAFWTYLMTKRAVSRSEARMWREHHLTEPLKVQKEGSPKGARSNDEDDEDAERRPLTDAEAVLLLTAPPPMDKRPRTYTRPLFAQLYALGLTTGMRLNEMCSLRPRDVQEREGAGLIVTVRRTTTKTDAGERSIPVVHPVAVRILKARIEAQEDRDGRLFSECAPGGPDDKPSWQVSKALGKDRRRLGIGDGAVFHSTRANFGTLMENAKIDSDHVKRYIGHVIDTVLAKHYSAGLLPENMMHIAEAVRYSEEVEAALATVAV